MSCATPGPG